MVAFLQLDVRTRRASSAAKQLSFDIRFSTIDISTT
jgi:hypothetical protein